MATGACEHCPYEYTAESKSLVLQIIASHADIKHGVGKIDSQVGNVVSLGRSKSKQMEEHMSKEKETAQAENTSLHGSFAIGKETTNYRRLEAKNMDAGEMFGSLYILPESLPEGATKANITVSFE